MSASRSLPVQRDSHRPAASRRLLYPLDALYARAHMTPPVAKRTTAERLPPACRELLVHHSGMTFALERRFGGAVTVRVLSSFSRGRWYFRRVLLVMEETGRPVAIGAIRLKLDFFGARVRARILGEQVPLGHILSQAGFQYHSHPTAFFQVTPTAEMMGFFSMRQADTLHGRRTQVTVRSERIGDIVEILALV
jgi:chorismate-pyruvate lyase